MGGEQLSFASLVSSVYIFYYNFPFLFFFFFLIKLPLSQPTSFSIFPILFPVPLGEWVNSSDTKIWHYHYSSLSKPKKELEDLFINTLNFKALLLSTLSMFYLDIMLNIFIFWSEQWFFLKNSILFNNLLNCHIKNKWKQEQKLLCSC